MGVVGEKNQIRRGRALEKGGDAFHQRIILRCRLYWGDEFHGVGSTQKCLLKKGLELKKEKHTKYKKWGMAGHLRNVTKYAVRLGGEGICVWWNTKWTGRFPRRALSFD